MIPVHRGSAAVVIAAPRASSDSVRRAMQANRLPETRPERLLRSALHARGLRFRKNKRLRVTDRWVRPDIVFGPTRIAVFVDGCFWHRCPDHATTPRINGDYWTAKFARNVARDRSDDKALTEARWVVIRIWEHEDANAAADQIESLVRASRNELAYDAK